jgi:hypothetical protein
MRAPAGDLLGCFGSRVSDQMNAKRPSGAGAMHAYFDPEETL